MKMNVFQEPDLDHLDKWMALFCGWMLFSVLIGVALGLATIDDDEQYMRARRARTPHRTIVRPLTRRKAA